MAQKAVRSEASSPNSLGPERDWPEVRGEECRPRTVLSWLLAKWVVGESEEAGRRTLSSHGPENPEEKEIALSLRRWVPLALGPAAEQKQNETEDSPPGPPPGEGAALFSPSPEKEQTPTSPGCPRQGRLVDFLDDLGPGWDAGGAALLREARRTGLCVDSAWGGAALEDAGGRPRRQADWGLAPGAAVDGASHRGRMCWIASVCCCTTENSWAKPSTVSPNSPPWEMGASRKRALSTSFISARLSQRWRSWTTMVDIAFPRDRAVSFVTRRAKSVAVRSSCINPGSVLPSCTCLSALAWWTCRIAMACRVEAAWPAAL